MTTTIVTNCISQKPVGTLYLKWHVYNIQTEVESDYIVQY